MLHQTFLKKKKGTFKYRAKTSDAKKFVIIYDSRLKKINLESNLYQPIDDPGLRDVFKEKNLAQVQKCQTFRDTLNVAVKKCQLFLQLHCSRFLKR